jgi:hypothetical protein
MNPRHLLFRCSIAIGLLLSVLLLVETIITYRYVEGDLVREEAQRVSDRHVRSLLRAARLMKVEHSSDLGPVLDEMVHEDPNQIAWIRIIASDGHVIVGSDDGNGVPSYSPNALQVSLQQHLPNERDTASGHVLSVLTPFSPLVFRLAERPPLLPLPAGTSQLEFVEVAMYVKGIFVNFGPLRQDLVVGLSAAIALLGTVVLVGTRFAAYVRAKKIEKELAVARQVQTDFFPTGNSSPMQVDYAARCVPAWEVGGDLYDVFDTDDGETAFVLGDVSGKGLPAALLMGFVQGAVRASCAGRSAGRSRGAVERLNSLLCAKTPQERFVTLFWCTFDARNGILCYVNAGHCPPLLVREDGEIRRLEAGGPVLGILAGARYDYGEVMVEAGELLVIFSDGIVEASNANEEEFGEDRLISTIQRQVRKPPADICNHILENVSAFIGTQTSQDDQTLVIARLESNQRRRLTSSEAELAGSVQAIAP